MSRVQIREVRTADELVAFPALERLVWGADNEMVSVNVLVATIHEGGMALGAYDGDTLVGMVYGFATRAHHVLHSHYLAVHPEWRHEGLGAELKRQQRAWCVEHGFTMMRWTFDPLQVGNAHLNLVTLGAIGTAYHPNLYGTLGGINGDLPSDRLVVQWDLVERRPAFTDPISVPIPDATADDIAAGNVAALAARIAVRVALTERLSAGWVVTGVDRAARVYELGRAA